MARTGLKGTTSKQTLLVGGLAVELTRKRVKNINLRVQRDGTVCVSASPRVPLAAIEAFVESRRDWIEEARQRVARAGETAESHCVDGGAWWLWGERLTIGLLPVPEAGRSPGCAFERQGDTLLVRVDRRIADDGEVARAARDRALASWSRTLLRAHIEETLPRCEALVGTTCSIWRLRTMRSRWGSCNVQTRAITLNTQLVHHDPRCLEYVIIHELCHLYEPSHNQHFHALMDRYCPDWRERRRLLNSR